VSGAGSDSLADLESGIREGLDGPPPPRAGGQDPFAWNVVPQIDRFEDNGYTREEMKIVWETRKVLSLPELPVTATAARVPVRVGHCAAVWVGVDRVVDPDEARALWRAFPGLTVGGDAVLVGRARRDLADAFGLVFWVASDNLRKGAALNAIQIAEALVQKGAPA